MIDLIVVISIAVLGARVVIELSAAIVEIIDALVGYFSALDKAYQHMWLAVWLATSIGLIALFGSLIATELYVAI